MSEGRYAAYFAPGIESPWWAFAAHWLGRDEVSGLALPQPVPPDFSAPEFARLTEEPRRYGVHATLCAPMHLKVAPEEFMRQVESLASRLSRVPLGTLVPVLMEGFVALVPARPVPGLQAFAEHCVTALAATRAPLTEAQRARRRSAPLDARGRELLERFGYPHVLERFRFHLTLTGPVDTATGGRLVSHASPIVARLNRDAPPVLDRLCVFHESAAGAPFRRVAQWALQP